MRVYLENPTGFFAWLHEKGHRYAVLRGGPNMGEEPQRGGKGDLDILIEDRAVAAVAARCRGTRRAAGVKADFYSETSGHGADYLGHAYFPEPLARAILTNRVRWQDAFDVPRDRDLYDALLFHLAYHKAEGCGADAVDSTALRAHKRFGFLRELSARLGEPAELSLMAMHRLLAARGYEPGIARLAAYLQNQARRRFRSVFYSLMLAVGQPGELNLFVLRASAVRRGFRQPMLDEIASRYEILAVRDIPWLTRLTRARYMRGNKWRWGGWPTVAVAAFDPAPIWRSAEERRQEHPLVFNSRQFFKRALRDRIAKEGRLYRKHNALHSTDNEAEAIGHLDLFFPLAEMQDILARVEERRAALRAVGASPFDPCR